MNSPLRPGLAIGLLLLFLGFGSSLSWGAGGEAEKPQAKPAQLTVFNRPMLVFRATIFGYTPAERAKVTSERIAAIVDKGVYGPVTIQPRNEGTAVNIGGEVAFMVMPGDVDPLEEKSYGEVVQESMSRLQAALEEARLQRNASYMAKASGRAVVATAVFLLALTLLVRLYRRSLPAVLALVQRLVKWLGAKGLVYLSQLARIVHWTLYLAVGAIALGLTTEWASVCLRCFPYTRPWGDSLQQNLWKLASQIFDAVSNALPDLLVIGLILVLARLTVIILRKFFQGIESGRMQTELMDVEAARATRRILTIVVWLFAGVMVYPYIPGSDSDAFKGLSVFVGLLLSLGSSSVVGQFTSGLVLMYSRALKPGEYVRIGDQEGTVESLGFLSTKIRSTKNEELHVPNTVILGTTVKNYSRLAEEGGLLLHTTVTIGYDAPWRQVEALLLRAARATPGLLPEPAPFVLQTALSDFYVEYQVNASLAKPQDRIRVLAALHANIQDQFNAHGVQIMSPHYLSDKPRPVVVPQENWYAPPAEKPERP